MVLRIVKWVVIAWLIYLLFTFGSRAIFTWQQHNALATCVARGQGMQGETGECVTLHSTVTP